jgi:hypothetical protein
MMDDRGGWRKGGLAARLPGLVAMAAVALLLGGCTLADLLPAENPDAPTSDSDSGSGGGAAGPTPTIAGGEIGLFQVESVEVVIRESFPPQISALVRGTLPDSCTEIGEILQSKSGNAVEVTIQTVRDPLAMCAQALVPTEVAVALDGDFPAGDYTVTVNGVDATFRV